MGRYGHHIQNEPHNPVFDKFKLKDQKWLCSKTFTMVRICRVLECEHFNKCMGLSKWTTKNTTSSPRYSAWPWIFGFHTASWI